MPSYHCACCDFVTHIKTHYSTHLNTKKHAINQEKYNSISRQNVTPVNSCPMLDVEQYKKKYNKQKPNKYRAFERLNAKCSNIIFVNCSH